MSFIETERLMLRTWMIPADVEAATAIFGDPEVMQFIGNGARPADAVRATLECIDEAQERDGFSLWPVIHKEAKQLIGDCGLQYIPGTRDVEIGWHFRRDAWGHGYATEAARAVLRYAFEELKLRRLHALIHPFNARSIAVANRVGMRFDRIVRAYKRDLLRYVKERAQ
jgi:ribosomal-protein-alanine N-acetyltransferase